jgi:hypothetical protein
MGQTYDQQLDMKILSRQEKINNLLRIKVIKNLSRINDIATSINDNI